MTHQGKKSTMSPLWVHYDREFCISRQSDPSLRWDSIHPRLYFQLFSKYAGLLRSDSASNRPPHGASSHMITGSLHSALGRGYCAHFNLYGSCCRLTKCTSLAHRCSLCNVYGHPAVRCHLYASPVWGSTSAPCALTY